MKNEDKDIGFEEIHITKRKDGQGFELKAKGIFNGDRSTIEIPFIVQPNLKIDTERMEYSHFFGKIFNNPIVGVKLLFESELKPQDEKYYTVTIDPKDYAKKQISQLEKEVEEIKVGAEKSIQNVLDRISKLKESI